MEIYVNYVQLLKSQALYYNMGWLVWQNIQRNNIPMGKE